MQIYKNWLKSKEILLILIFLLGAFVRFVCLGDYPVGFHSQEALLGYRARSLLTIGKDELSRSWPLIFTSFIDYQLPLPTYLVMLSVKIFGPSEFSVHFFFAFFGVISILALFGVVRNLFPQRKNLAYWVAFLMAVVPWSVFLSRIAFPEGLGLFLFLIGFYFLSKQKGRFSKINFLGAVIFLIASLYTTKTAWLFIPVFLIGLLFIGNELGLRRKLWPLIIIVLILFSPLLIGYLKLPSVKRSFLENNFSLFTDISVTNAVNSMRGNELKFGNPLLGKLFFNKGYWLVKYGEKFLAHFSPAYYFAIGDQNSLHGLWNFGPVYFVLLLPCLWGMWWILKNKEQGGKLLLFWFSLVAVASSFIKKSPDTAILIFALPVILVLIGLGMEELVKRRLLLIFLPLFVFNILLVTYDALQKEPIRAQSGWFYGFKEVPMLLKKYNYQDFDKVYLTDGYAPDPAPLLLFFSQYSSVKLQKKETSIKYHFWMNQIENIHIGRVEEFSLLPGERGLFVVTPQEEKNWLSKLVFLDEDKEPSEKRCYKIYDEIVGLDNKPVLLIASSLADNCVLVKPEK